MLTGTYYLGLNIPNDDPLINITVYHRYFVKYEGEIIWFHEVSKERPLPTNKDLFVDISLSRYMGRKEGFPVQNIEIGVEFLDA